MPSFMRQKEIRFLHPLVAEWLSANGYSHTHEVKMPQSGRADFLATHLSGQKLVIECKLELRADARRDIFQLLDYCDQLGDDTEGAMAAPAGNIRDEAINLCRRYKVKIIVISKYV